LADHEPDLDRQAERAHLRGGRGRPRRPAAVPDEDAARPGAARDRRGPGHRPARRRRRPPRVRARGRDRGRGGRPRRRVPGHAVVDPALQRAGRADLRLRDRRHRRPRLAVGDARRRHRAGRGAERRRPDRPELAAARRARRLPGCARRPGRPRRDRLARRPAGGAGEGMSTATVQRWTAASLTSSGAVGCLVAALAFVPVALSANATDKLTTFLVYLILAAMWNALAGYAGLVSVGQQAFFGLGAYFAIKLSNAGVGIYPALVLGALCGGAVSVPVSWFMLRLRGGEFAIGMWVVSEIAFRLVILDYSVGGLTGTSIGPAQRQLLARARCGRPPARRRLRAAAQPHGRVAAGDPRRRGGGGVRRRARPGRQGDRVRARGLRLRRGRQPLAGDEPHLPAGRLLQ